MLLENEVRVFTIIIKVVVTQMNNQQLILFVCLFICYWLSLEDGLIDGHYM